jgi:5'-methylthioadenosine phosphorylase
MFMKFEKAIIGGTGFYDPQMLEDRNEHLVKTSYGEAYFLTGTYKGVPLVFMTRHGVQHNIPPHRINFRANIAALKDLGVTRVVAGTAVGSLREDLTPGELVIIDQFIDFTRGEVRTFYDGEGGKVVHTDFSQPYCPQVRKRLSVVMTKKGIPFVDGGTYLTTDGPRYETPAEIKVYSLWGADVVGMTNAPEAILAREAGLCYANISLITNYAAGISPHPLSHQEVVEMMGIKIGLIREIFLDTLVALPQDRDCLCGAVEDFDLGP